MTENSLGDRRVSPARTNSMRTSSMRKNWLRKTDRRTMVTLEMIRRAFVSLVNRQPYSKTTVAQVCRAAGITRSTFYFHYASLRDLLDDVLDRALQFNDDDPSEGSSAASHTDRTDGTQIALGRSGTHRARTVTGIMNQVDRAELVGRANRADRLVPACQRAAGRPEYRALLMDSDLSEYIVQRIAAHEQDRVIPEIRRNTGLSEEDARTLFLYMVHGSFAINKRHGFVRDAQWKHEADLLDRFVRAGNRAFRR